MWWKMLSLVITSCHQSEVNWDSIGDDDGWQTVQFEDVINELLRELRGCDGVMVSDEVDSDGEEADGGMDTIVAT